MIKTHYISPYSSEKPLNIGGAINTAINTLKAEEEDWIVLTDHDVLFLLPDSKAQIESILENTEFDVLGPLTNRVGIADQVVAGLYSQDSLKQHIKFAQLCQEQLKDEVYSTRGPVAAFCMCFKLKTWNKLAGFHEKVLNFDLLFCESAKKANMKIGIMQGVYVLHLYRYLSKNPRTDIKHLNT